MRRLRPDHLAGQITLLILVSITMFQTIVIIMFHVLDVEGRKHIVDESDFVAGVILALDVAPISERAGLLAGLSHAAPYANISIQDASPKSAEGGDRLFINEVKRINAHLWRDAGAFVTSAAMDGAPGVLAVPLRKGGHALISIAQHQKPPRSVWRWLWQPESDLPFILTPWARAALFFFISTAVLVIWASNGIVAPLVKLARHAEQFPNQGDAEARLAEQGPHEVRELTRSINRMQSRIRSMIAARARVLAAVSHDLRTIITRLKLRTEFIPDPALQMKMVQDIDLMDAMLYKNLQYLRAESDKSDRSLIDIDSVLQTVSDQFCDLGHDVRYSGGRHQMIVGSLTEMQRVFTNLVENAAHHAASVEISVSELPSDRLQIDVADDGPGIPAEDKASAFEPFVRGQPARTIGKHSGFGLGLSIVRSLVENHGGTVQLLDRRPHGLVARVILPRGAASDQD